ncbi:MAG: GNAT family N-acetyltransferase [Saprospiraceae bacterium]|nr:GNAT family N-acetyltransferase [Saprospiraceae bacterium]
MNELLISGQLTLRPATLADKRKIYNWLAHSNLTCEMMGPPAFPEITVSTWNEFNDDYLDYYFDGSEPWKGQCFIMEHNGQEIGQINYNEIDKDTKSTEMDIWMADRKYTGKGLGTTAINLLCHYLESVFDCESIYIAPSFRNINAIKSYQKAGFVETENIPDNFIPDYDDTIVLVKTSRNDAKSRRQQIKSSKMELRVIHIDEDMSMKLYTSPECQEIIKSMQDYYPIIGFNLPWVGYFVIKDNVVVGLGAFTGKPKDGVVEIAYSTFKDYEGQGIASYTCKELVAIAKRTDPTLIITAKTKPEHNASTKILQKNGFEYAGIVQDHEIGDAWLWILKPYSELSK